VSAGHGKNAAIGAMDNVVFHWTVHSAIEFVRRWWWRLFDDAA
jgi:hypothetical protein